MPLSADDFVQEDTGFTAASTTFDVTLPAGTTDGNTVIVAMSSGLTAAATGFASDGGGFYSKVVGAGETSWTFTQGAATVVTWTVYEISGLAAVVPLDGFATASGAPAPGGTLSTGTTAENTSLNTVVFARFQSDTTAADATWDSYTNGFEEIAVAPAVSGSAGHYLRHSLARKFVDAATGQFETTATLAGTGTDNTSTAVIVVYRSATAPVKGPLFQFTGHEQGTHGGLAQNVLAGGDTLVNSAINWLAAGTWGTNYLVQAGSARHGGYGLRITSTAAVAHVPTHWFGTNVTHVGVWGVNLRVVSASGTPVVLEGMDHSGVSVGIQFQVLYDATNSKFGLRRGTTGTVSWQDSTTATNTWVWIDLRCATTGTSRLAWRLETATDTYTDQPAPADTTETAYYQGFLRLGSLTAQTLTMDVDDVVANKSAGAYPLGLHKVVLLKVDPAGTPTVSGTSTNFSVFTANGTLAAWNAANARNALDEVPPDISASADGVCQTAVAASDYMEFPMETYTCTPSEVIAGVRVVACLWGGTGTGTGTLGVRGWDGTTEAALVSNGTSYDADSLTTASATNPMWATKNWYPAGGWTQAKLDAAAVRVGFSSDATPDMGVRAVYLEVAIRPTSNVRIHAIEDAAFAADLRYNPSDITPVSYLVTTPADRGATFAYTLLGTPTSTYVNPGASQELAVAAATYGDVTDTQLYPDPVP